VELLGALPVLLVLALALCQLLAVGHSALLAANAAEAGALAVAGRGDAVASVRRALPGWTRARARVRVRGGRVTVRMSPPSLLPAMPQVSSTARVVR
jgi:hypothetical protein